MLKALPVHRRQSAQWQSPAAPSWPLYSNRTSPQRQPPVTGDVMAFPPCFSACLDPWQFHWLGAWQRGSVMDHTSNPKPSTAYFRSAKRVSCTVKYVRRAEGPRYPSIFTYSKSPGLLSIPARGGAIQPL